jgi:O-antigen/teichoic acid export membrane protein
MRGTVVLTLGRLVGYGLSFLRNLILARMLAKADYGLAAVFAMATTLLEVSGSMAYGVQVVQSKYGDASGFQGSAHVLQFLGGLCSAMLLVGMSVPMAHLFKVPHASWAFALLAVVPLSQGLCHLDISRRQRELDYLPLVLMDVVPQLLITAAVWPLALWVRDYRVIVWLMIGKAVLGLSMTFFLAQRPYRWAWEREHIRSMLSFGWPLLLTGLLMFGSGQVDQVLVGAVFSLSELASYALAASIVSIPWFIIGQAGSSLILPVMSRAQDDPERFRQQYRVCADAAAVIGVVVTLPLIVVGEQLVTLLYGGKYLGTGVFMGVLGAGAALRFLRFASTVAATARADTLNHLYSNLWRGAGVSVALVVVALGGKSVQIAACTIVAEVLAVVVSMVRLWRHQGIRLQDNYRATAYVITLVSIELGFALIGGAKWSIWSAGAVAIVMFMFALGTAWLLFPEIGRLVIQAVRRGAPVGVGQTAAT